MAATKENTQEKVRVFVSYSHKDRTHKEKLLAHLSVLKRSNLIETWHDGEIKSGDNFNIEIKENLEKADIILLLLSADFIASSYCYEIELQKALIRHKNKEAFIIPIMVDKFLIEKTIFKDIQVLPKNGQAVTLWKIKAEAYTNIVEGINDRILQFIGSKQQTTSASPLEKKTDSSVVEQLFKHLDRVIKKEVNDTEDIIRTIDKLCKIAKESPNVKTEIFNKLCSYIVKRTNPSLKENFLWDREWIMMDSGLKHSHRPHWDVQYVFNALFRDGQDSFGNLTADLSNAQLQNINLIGMTFKKANFRNASLQHASMYSPFGEKQDTKFIGCDFSGAYLDGANISSADLSMCDFSFAKLRWANLYGSTLINTIFDGADMTGCLLGEGKINASFKYSILDGAEISLLNFVTDQEKKTNFENTSFIYASLFGNNLNDSSQVQVKKADTTGAQTNMAFRDGNSRVKRLILYKDIPDDTAFNEYGQSKFINQYDPVYKKMKYNSIVKTFKDYVVLNNSAENLSDLKDLKNI